MGLLDNVKKNLGFGGKDASERSEAAPVDQSAASQAAEDAAAVEVSAADKAAAEAAAAQAARQQEAADAAAATGQPGPVAPRVTEVVVEQGDTMDGIAAQYGVDLGALIATNADTVPNPDRIYPGQVLRLP